MAGTEDDFLELLGGEVMIDMDRLVDTARHGIPDKVRGEVWKHLLEVSKPDKCMLYCIFMISHIFLNIKMASYSRRG